LRGIKPQAIEVDPSAASFIMQLKRDSVGHVYQADNEVLEGIQVVSQALEDKKLLIHRGCKHLISQLATYSWDPAASKRGEDKPLKHNDHAVDALRYASMRAIKRGVFAAPISIQQESHWRGLADYYT
jgi:phage terminase large subunit